MRWVLRRTGLGPRASDLARRREYRADSTLRQANDRLIEAGAPDGLPLPSPYLMYLVSWSFSLQLYLEKGALGADCIRQVLEKNGLDIGQFESILDWGCGCGRIMRQWATLKDTHIHGCDYNPRLSGWCSQAFPQFSVRTCRSLPPLPYENESFDFLYAVSVLTHIRAEHQVPWVRELARVLRPGGFALLTFHGSTRAEALGVEMREHFREGQLVVLAEQNNGTNYCAAFHPQEYIRREFGPILRVVDHVPDGARDAGQDAVLFQKA